MQLTYRYGEEEIVLKVEREGDLWRVILPDGSAREISARRQPGDILQIEAGDRTQEVAVAHTARGIEIAYGGATYVFTEASARRSRSGRAAKSSSGMLEAPMAGVVADVLVKEGDKVVAYQPVVVVAAMKVYATVESPFDGIVKAVRVAKEQRVEHGAVLAEIAPVSEGRAE